MLNLLDAGWSAASPLFNRNSRLDFTPTDSPTGSPVIRPANSGNRPPIYIDNSRPATTYHSTPRRPREIPDDDETDDMPDLFLDQSTPIASTPLAVPTVPLSEKDRNFLNFCECLRNNCDSLMEPLDEFYEEYNCRAISDQQKVANYRAWLERNYEILERITELDISDCALKRIPKEIHYFSSLQHLHLRGNRIESVSSLKYVPYISWIDLSNNELTAPPRGLEKSNVKHIILKDNRLKELPSFINKLKYIELKGNPCGLPDSSKKKWDGDREDVYKYCRTLFLISPLVHCVASLVNIAYRMAKIISLSHFYQGYQSGQPYQFKARMSEFSKDLFRLIASPIAMVALQLMTMYGHYRPYQGVIGYAKIETYVYGEEIYGNPKYEKVILGSLLALGAVLTILSILKADKFI